MLIVLFLQGNVRDYVFVMDHPEFVLDFLSEKLGIFWVADSWRSEGMKLFYFIGFDLELKSANCCQSCA